MSKLRIFLAGHNGMVGSALLRFLKKQNVKTITINRSELDLLNQNNVNNYLKDQKIDQIYLAAAKVGGIFYNSSHPADFIYENLVIQTNVIHGAFLSGVKKLLFLGSSCIYPRNVSQPISEDKLLTGKLEKTNEPYAIAKIAGIKMCESYNRQYGRIFGIDYRCLMPTNLYGPGDNYHPENSHVIPGLINRLHNAKIKKLAIVNIWGTGKPKREFLYVDDLAKASIHLMNLDKKVYDKHTSSTCSHVNIGTGSDISIKELAYLIKDIIGYKGKIKFDTTKPDGTPRKILNSSLINTLGFKPKKGLREGILETYKHYLKHVQPH